MKSILQSLVIFLILVSCAIAQEPIRKINMPLEVKMELSDQDPKDIEGLQWNRWTSKNFTVLSLDDTQAQYLHKNLEQIKSWLFSRWGLYDVDFSAECKLICVDDPELFEKMFRLKKTTVNVRRDENGKIKESVIFLLINDSPSHTIPVPLTEVCLSEFNQKYNADFGWWSNRGMGMLNGPLEQIRGELFTMRPYIQNNDPIYFSKGLLEMTKDKYENLSLDKQELYDKSALAMTLLIRKEYGQDKLHWFLKKYSEGEPELAVQEVLGFESYDEFDRIFKRYLFDLVNGVETKETPDSYLQIKGKEE